MEIKVITQVFESAKKFFKESLKGLKIDTIIKMDTKHMKILLKI